MQKINKMNSPLFAKGKAKWDAFLKSYDGPYDFSPAVYAGMNQKVEFVCPSHGVQTSDAKNLMAGKQCYKCAVEARAGKPRVTLKKLVSRFKEVHGDLYSYENTVYSGVNSKINIECKKHGMFSQRVGDHQRGAGCPQCFHEDRRGSGQRDTAESFIEKAQGIYGELFDFSSVIYKNSQTKITVKCNEHNEICETKPNWILSGYNPCSKCNHMKSQHEEAIARYLSIFTPVVQRDRTILAPKELDSFLPEKNIAIEYCGEYWHSHGDKEDESKNKLRHYNKFAECAKKGIRLITIYESEYLHNPRVIRRLLRNAIGASKGKLMARKCELKKVAAPEAREFYNKYHPQGGNGAGEHYALFHKDVMVACMRFTFGSNDRGSNKGRTWTLSRYATRINVAGAASKLFKTFLREYDFPVVKSFSDNRYFSGGMYESLGFELVENVNPDYVVWHPKLGLKPKPHWQRRALPKRILEVGSSETFEPATDTRTEREMTYLVGGRRLYDCGKKRWVWRA